MSWGRDRPIGLALDLASGLEVSLYVCLRGPFRKCLSAGWEEGRWGAANGAYVHACECVSARA